MKEKKSNLIRKIKKRKPWETIIVSDNLTWSEFSRLNLFLHDMQGIKPVVALARKYSSRWILFTYHRICFRCQQ